jgi:hypothetical protein
MGFAGGGGATGAVAATAAVEIAAVRELDVRLAPVEPVPVVELGLITEAVANRTP